MSSFPGSDDLWVIAEGDFCLRKIGSTYQLLDFPTKETVILLPASKLLLKNRNLFAAFSLNLGWFSCRSDQTPSLDPENLEILRTLRREEVAPILYLLAAQVS